MPKGRKLAEFRDIRGRSFIVQGPERVALTGRNGIGKTRLLETLVHFAIPRDSSTSVQALTDRIGYLPQRLDHLDDDATLLDTVRAAAHDVPDGELRSGLARFLFRGDVIQRRVADLWVESGSASA